MPRLSPSKLIYFLLWLGFAIFYLAIAPLHIQGGDTAELVTAGYHRLVAHPPGYPLYSWMLHLWTNVFNIFTVYWRAAVYNALLGLSSLAVLLLVLKDRWPFAICVVLSLGLEANFLEASLLPDVFALHGFFIVLIGYFYLFAPDLEKRAFFLPLMVFLSFANHHTSVLLIPCFIAHAFERPGRNFLQGLGLGILLTTLLYLSLFLMQPTHALSWGMITDISSLIGHMLRFEYGTFNLAPTGGSFGLQNFRLLLQTLLPFTLLFAYCGYLLTRNNTLIRDRRLQIWSLCLLLTIGFSFMMNINPVHAGEEVVKRFHLMPLMTLIIWMSYVVQHSQQPAKSTVLVFLAAAPVLIHNALTLPPYWDLRNDSVIEDYAQNLYLQAKKHAPSLLVVNSDPAYFGIRYLQSLDPNSGQVGVVALPLLFNPWVKTKLQMKLPEFTLLNEEKIYEKRSLEVKEEFITPNVDKISLIVNRSYGFAPDFQSSFLAVGRILRTGQGLNFTHFQPYELQLRSSLSTIPEGYQAFTRGSLYYQYAHAWLAQAVQAHEQGNATEAKRYWKKSLEVVPYAYPAMENLCRFYPNEFSFCQKELLEALADQTLGFY